MKLFLKLFVVFVYGLFYSQLNSQELPPIDTYSTSDYHAENQNWDISQAANKHIYIANNKGLLEFNGEKWQLYPSPNETILRSVFVKDASHLHWLLYGIWLLETQSVWRVNLHFFI